MQGLMQDRELLISSIISFAAAEHGNREVVSKMIDGKVHRYTYAEAEKRAKRLGKAMLRLGAQLGDRLGTIAWNSYRHFEIYYGVSGIGAVCHTLNPRLFPEQLIYILNHAEDSYLFVDLTFLPLVEALAEHLPALKGVIIMAEEAEMPETKLPAHIQVLCFEALIAAEDDDFAWPQFEERTASSLCYTSGTTGNPKGVLYAHRSTVLHAYAAALPDSVNIGSRSCILPVVPMFHANAWAIPYSAPMVGAKLVFPGAHMLDGEVLCDMMENEKVTFAAGVPTIWLSLLNHLRETGKKLSTVKQLMIGGSACPTFIMEAFLKDYGISTIHGWGMTETSPLGSINKLKAGQEHFTADEQIAHQAKQGRGIFGIEMKIIGDAGNDLPRDGKAFGRLMVRGPWVVSGYFKAEGGDVIDQDGWFDTGDVATIDPDGFMQITDRSKDVIKSGGEWIGSIELENLAIGHPDVMEAAVIACPHPKWDERPLLVVVRNEGADPAKEDILGFFEGKIAKWWTPDDVVFVDELPHTATGKILKTKLREQYKDYILPTA